MEQASFVLFWFAFALYVGATVLYAYQFILRRQKVIWWARFFTGAGFLVQTASIGLNSIAHGGTLLNGANQLVLASWALVLLYFIIEHVLRIRIYGAFLIPVAVIMLVIAQLLRTPAVDFESQDPLVKGFGIAFHVALIVFANAGFIFGAVSSMLYLYQNTQLKRHKSTKVSRRLPSLAALQRVSRQAIALAFPVYTAGLTLGIIRAIQTDVGGWWIDPRVILSGIVWFTFGLYLVLVYRHDVSARTAAWVSVAGLFLVVTLSVIARTVPVGFHLFGLGG